MRNLIVCLALGFLLTSCAEPLTIKPVTGPEIIEVVSSYKGKKVVLLNVWATWCGPCVEEFPDIVKVAKKYRDDVEVVFISADYTEQTPGVLEFLKSQGVTWKTYIKDGADEAFILAIDENWTGAIPATAVFNKNGEKIAFWEDKASYETFEKTIISAL